MVRQNNLRQLRKQQNLPIMELAAKTGVSTAVIVAVERYNLYPGPSVRERLAAALGVSEALIWPEVDVTSDGRQE